MKNLSFPGFMLFVLLFAATGFTLSHDSGENVLTKSLTPLTEDEKSNLQFMREEEKLARDAYLYFHEKYGLKIFKNIASSEQKHIDAVLAIMEKHGVEDLASDEKGIFTNADLQQLYADLIVKGNLSLVGALSVGATIEDVDIRDLGTAIAATSKTELIKMYQRLECGSRNHLRAFTRQLNSRSETYTPQFISQKEYEKVINGKHERCGR